MEVKVLEFVASDHHRSQNAASCRCTGECAPLLDSVATFPAGAKHAEPAMAYPLRPAQVGAWLSRNQGIYFFAAPAQTNGDELHVGNRPSDQTRTYFDRGVSSVTREPQLAPRSSPIELL